jgi:hypothetical protein
MNNEHEYDPPNQNRLTEREIWEEIRIARLASVVAVACGFINLAVILFFALMVVKGGVLK